MSNKYNDDRISSIIELYKSIKLTIENRIVEFKELWNKSTENDIFYEFVFCLLTPQSKAVSADKAVKNLISSGAIWSDDASKISEMLNIVRFKNNKAKYIIESRQKFTENGEIHLKHLIDSDDIYETREWLLNNIKGFGLKESSHFLRNIGFGEDLTILDRHILKNLKLCGVIQDEQITMTKNRYYRIEEAMKEFARYIKIPVDHLDFVFWYKEAGEVFK